MKIKLLLISVVVLFPSILIPVFAHGVHSGIRGTPVGGSTITDWHKLELAKDVTFEFTLIIYGLILVILWFSKTYSVQRQEKMCRTV